MTQLTATITVNANINATVAPAGKVAASSSLAALFGAKDGESYIALILFLVSNFLLNMTGTSPAKKAPPPPPKRLSETSRFLLFLMRPR